ncbi:MAG: ribosome maturation factor RimP [Candidatus Oxydemutatoraceae bacterium WSBS_2016_MAG_OTU14]
MAYKDLVKVIKPVVKAMGYDCWGVQFSTYGRRALLRVFIDQPDGVTLDDCTDVSQQLSSVLDVENALHRAYTLEVSSPGLERLLFEPEHYQCYVGEKVRLNLYQAIDQKRKVTGVINAVEKDTVVILLEGETMRVPFAIIRRANLVFEQTTNAVKRK